MMGFIKVNPIRYLSRLVMKKSTICSLLFISTLTATGTAHAVKYAGEYSPAWSPDGQWIAYHKKQ